VCVIKAGVAALGLGIAPDSSVQQISDWISSTATRDALANVGTGSPNLLVYSRLSASPPQASSPSTTISPTTTVPPTSTTIPSAPGGGGDSGGGDGGDDGGGDDAPETTTTSVPRTTVPTPTTPTTRPTSNSPSEQTRAPRTVTDIPGTNRLVNPRIGSQLPAEVLAAASSPASSKVVGNNVVLNVQAPALSMVHVYRDGVLVKTVPAAAARAIKITKNKLGDSSFQAVVVDKTGKMTITGKRTVLVQKASK